MKTILWKELRETVRWLPVGILVAGMACYVSLPARNYINQPVASTLTQLLSCVAAIFAFVLGVLQSAPDLRPSASAYLHHRAVRCGQIFAAKTLAGLIVYVAALGIPLLLTAFWLGIHGVEEYPVRPAQVLPASVMCLACFGLHSAAMFTMARNASWWGTRLLPVVVAVLPLFFLGGFLNANGLTGVFRALPWALAAVALLVLGSRHAWCRLAGEPEGANAARAGWPVWATLVLGSSFVVVTTALIAQLYLWSRSQSERPVMPYYDFAVDRQSGDAWLVALTPTLTVDAAYIEQPQTHTPVTGALLADGVRLDLNRRPPADVRQDSVAAISPIVVPVGGDGFFAHSHYLGSGYRVYDARGYVLIYGPNGEPGLKAVISYDGLHAPGTPPGRRFEVNPIGRLTISNALGLFITGEGVFQLDSATGQLHAIVQIPIEWVSDTVRGVDETTHILLGTAETLYDYRLVDAQGSDEWARASKLGESPVSLPPPLLQAALVRSVPLQSIPFSTLSRAGTIGISDAGYTFIWPTYRQAGKMEVLRLDNSGQLVDRFAFDHPNNGAMREPQLSGIPLGVIPPVCWAALELSIVIADVWQGRAPEPFHWWTRTTLQATVFAELAYGLLAVILTAWLARRRTLSRTAAMVWIAATLLLGLAGPLSLAAIIPRVPTAICHHCQRLRRVSRHALRTLRCRVGRERIDGN